MLLEISNTDGQLMISTSDASQKASPIELTLGGDLQPIWPMLDLLHDGVARLYDDPSARHILDSLLLVLGGVDVTIRDRHAVDTLVTSESKDGSLRVSARPVRME